LAVLMAFIDNAYTQQRGPGGRGGRMPPAERSRQYEQQGLADPFKGVTTDGRIREGLFHIESTGVSTQPVVDAAKAFLAGLDDAQRSKTTFAVDDNEWRMWMNQHFYVRQGVGFDEMNDKQRRLAFDFMGAALSADGLKLSQDIMKLNGTLGELTGRHEEYTEWLYWITIMGEPSTTKPWGWQVDGHHLIINYFVLGDQVVMSPFFLGSEPVEAEGGRFKGTIIMQDEQRLGLKMVNSLDDPQKAKAVIESSKLGNNNQSEAWKDNVVIPYAGIPGSELNARQKEQLLALIGRYVNYNNKGHAGVKMSEVKKHLDDTHFAWVGATDENAVFYYRIHSPVVLIEFDHQRPIALERTNRPTRQHIHAIVRTPNGNDYGKDLLRQHLETHHKTGE
jgi:hypothetical protein